MFSEKSLYDDVSNWIYHLHLLGVPDDKRSTWGPNQYKDDVLPV